MFWWRCPYFTFLIHNFNSTSSPSLMYYNIFLFATAYFNFLIYSFKVTFYATLNIFFFTTDWLNPLLYVKINIWIGGVIFCSTCSGCFINKKAFFWRRLRCTFLFLFLSFFLSQSFNFCCTLIPLVMFFIVSIKRHFSPVYNPSRQLNVFYMKSKNLWLRFIASSSRT